MHDIDITRIDLNLLVVFEALLEERHVGRAAERLRLSQSATSHALGRLRRLFDDPLFVRHAAGIEPTHRALGMADDLAGALAKVRRVVSPVRFDPATFERVVTIATHEYVVVMLMPRLLSILRREAPGVDMRCVGLSYRDLVTAFERGDVDLACGAFPGFDAKRIERTPLFEDRFVGVVQAGHPALTRGCMDIEAFASLPHVWVSIGNGFYDPIAAAMADRGLTRRIAMTVQNVSSVPAIVASSDLVGVVPRRIVDTVPYPLRLDLFELPVEIAPVSCDFLITGTLTATPEARWLKDIFTRAAADQATQPIKMLDGTKTGEGSHFSVPDITI